jgi:hypothetical protein
MGQPLLEEDARLSVSEAIGRVGLVGVVGLFQPTCENCQTLLFC